MQLKKTTALALAAVTAAATGAVALVGAGAAEAQGTIPVVTVHISSTHVRLSTGNTLHAGRVIYRVVTTKGDHALQIARLHKGYTLQEAGQDLTKAFSGDVTAIRRVDSHITFRGGAEARPNKPGRVSIVLSKGTYVFTDQESNAFTMVNVVGTTPKRPNIPAAGSITAYTYGFGIGGTLPADGWIRIGNVSDQPHFVEFQHVKASTTNAMVRKFLQPANMGSQPSWALKASTDAAVLSPYRYEKFHTHLPAGKYLIMCFWPDDDTGMPHAFMGMWKLIWLT
jgi:hypothetical protein